MDPQKRRDLLSKLETIAKCDGQTSTRHVYRTFCDALEELLKDSVYLTIPQADMTEATEVEVTTDG